MLFRSVPEVLGVADAAVLGATFVPVAGGGHHLADALLEQLLEHLAERSPVCGTEPA